MKRCPVCNGFYSNHEVFCPQDGQSLEAGFILDDKYQLEQVIGQGGMGQVYRATHIHIGTPVAVKILKPDLVSDPVLVERFRREARAAAQMRHPNAVLVTDFGVERTSGTVYLVMEYLEGVSLKAKIEQAKRLTLEESLLILGQICGALQVAHDKGIVHRDIKPDNIFLARTESGQQVVKVLDFGIAKLKKNLHEDTTGLTQTGAVIGTPWYMSPEQCRTESLDARSDIYSLGITAYQMLTGTIPFRGPGFSKILMQHCHESPTPLRRFVPDLPSAVETVILRALEKKPAKRPQNATEFFESLQKAALKTGNLPLRESGEKVVDEKSRNGSSHTPAKTMPAQGAGYRPALAGTPTGGAPAAKEEEFVSSDESPTGAFDASQIPTVPPPDTPLQAMSQKTLVSSGMTVTHTPVSATPVSMPAIPEKPQNRLKLFLVIGLTLLVLGGVTAWLLPTLRLGGGGKPEQPTQTTPQTPPGMVWVPGGTLTMGNNQAQDLAEKPEHEVPINPFFMDIHEVTNEDFLKFVQAKKYPAPPHWKNGLVPPGEDKFPVTNVRWEDAQAFALWAGKRLPTEEEWEWAARGDRRQTYPWGNDFTPTQANVLETQKNHLMPVGSFPSGASFCGAMDLIGNAAEWTVSDYAPYPGSQAKPVAGQKIIRGGGFQTEHKKATSTKRFLDVPGTRDITLGFRCVQDLPAKPEIP
ncbi:MAG: SUMF1/EgtB/PvdO family nonheme iron enzyme [Blastocatellia bacterium]|nr:SUMF1/EgtB/PvdO family nonheme iron enzyme [Blastocatellia bacterium]